MDLLCSLGIESLPEQSTRLVSHPGIIKTLRDNADARIGFTHCCNCGARLGNEAKACKGCQRVTYCSKACCKADAEEIPSEGKDGLEDEIAVGHNAVICSLLKLCNDDDEAEDQIFEHGNETKSRSQKQGQAAHYRIQTEQESYPATLFNVLAESPAWFMEAMTRRIRYLEDVRSPEKQRRGKRDRSTISPCKKQPAGNKQLVIHVVGASTNCELWGWDGGTKNPAVLNAYAEASIGLLSYIENFQIILKSVRIVFIGPDCPTHFCHNLSIPDSQTELIVETHCHNYGEHADSIPTPDAIVFFNPGFSCPDYDWSESLLAASKYAKAGPLPFLVTTNTEMEGFADIKYLLDSGCISSNAVPSNLLEAIDSVDSGIGNKDDTDKAFFFGENPYHGLRVRQSGTMANDLFVKSMWILGGLFEMPGSLNKRKIKADAEEKNEDGHAHPKKKQRGAEEVKGNSKKSNPALI